ncbi:DUF4926 domain-containing protein [Acinetobacter sp. RW6]|jgi:hypothetical protein|uniref:DUF4926 domain-containing protein n=1 Tax=Acinetobacter sp. RW6 TaxID=3242680 RepID=UPI0035BEC0BD
MRSPKYEEYQVVKTIKNLNSLPIGSIGTILIVYTSTNKIAYEVEFIDKDGNFIGTFTVEEPFLDLLQT